MPLASVYPLLSTRSLARPFTYEVDADVEVGAIVAIRLGRQTVRGVVTEVGVAKPAGVTPVPVGRVLATIPATLVELAVWLAESSDRFGRCHRLVECLLEGLQRSFRLQRLPENNLSFAISIQASVLFPDV